MIKNGDICVTRTGAIGIYSENGIFTTEGMLPAEDFDPDFVLRYAPNGVEIDTVKSEDGIHFPVVMAGMCGLTVFLVQQALQYKRYYNGKIDGIFGAQTHQALYDFMKDHYISGETKATEEVLKYLFKDE